MKNEGENNGRRLGSKQIVGLMIIVGVVLYGLFAVGQPGLRVGVNSDEEYIFIERSGRNIETETIRVAVDDILSIQYLQEFDLGTFVEGNEEKNYSFGTWQNDSIGEYRRGTFKGIDAYLLIETIDGYVLINFESSKNTEEFAKALREVIE